jgi:hypothetical protein
MRWLVSILFVIHGLIHLMGFVKAFGFAAMPQLTQPISRSLGVAWLIAGIAFVIAAWLPWRVFWPVTAVAVVLSQLVIVSSWTDAKFGTVANVIAALVAGWAFASAGPTSLRAQWEREVDALLAAAPKSPPVLTEADLASAPPIVQTFLRRSGAVGQPRIVTFRATWRGRIRASADAPWMTIEGSQFNDVEGERPGRLFLFGAVMKGLPATVFHRFLGDEATFRVRLLDLAQVVTATGPELRRAETVTILNDLCLFAPGVLLSPRVRLEPLDALRVKATYTRGPETVSAELRFNEQGDLLDFICDDRLAGPLDDGRFERRRWSTPLRNPMPFAGRLVPALGEARWHPASGEFTSIELELLDFEPNPVARDPSL